MRDVRSGKRIQTSRNPWAAKLAWCACDWLEQGCLLGPVPAAGALAGRGAVAAIEQGFVQGEIEASAFRWQHEVESGERVIVGVNALTSEAEEPIELHRLDPAAVDRQLARTAGVRAARDAQEADTALARVRQSARGDGNLLVPMREALRARCTVGEICGVLREEWGEHDRRR